MADLPLLVSADTLASHLGDPAVRIVDATVFLTIPDDGSPAISVSGRTAFDEAHIPGAVFADLLELSHPDNPLPYMLPRPAQFAADMEALGIGEGAHVVVYDAEGGAWATRLWWMLRYHGFDAVSVLDGGRGAWQAAGHPLIDEATPAAGAASFPVRLRPELLVDKKQVAEYSAHGGACVVNALPPPLHSGEVPLAPGRAGHIPGSINLSHGANLDPDTGCWLPVEQLRDMFAHVLDQDTIITYCGGGIAATGDAYVLALLGRDDVAVYDGSMVEWVSDPDAPMEQG